MRLYPPERSFASPFAIREDPQRLVQVRRADVVELARDHRAAYLLPAVSGDWLAHPARTGDWTVATTFGPDPEWVAMGCSGDGPMTERCD